MKKIWKHPDKLVTTAAALFVAALTSVLFFYAAASMGEIRTSEHFIIESDTLSIGGTPETSSSFNSEGSAGQALTGTGESANYKLFGGFEETLNSTPDSPSTLSQNTVGGTTIETGGWIPPGTVVIKFNMYDPDSSDILTPQVELRPTTESFTGSPTYAGSEVSFGGSTVEGVVTVEGLTPGTYHWRVRVLDAGMLSSPWVSFGGNPETAKDLWVKGYGFISGTVILSGEADNSGTLIEAFDSGTVWGSAETASDGSYLVRVLEGTYSVEATKTGFEMKDFPAPEVVSPYSTVEGINITLSGAWPMFKQDRWHTGFSPDTLISTPLTLRWSYTTGWYVYSNPAEVNGKLFIGGYDKNVYALNTKTGAFIWSYPTGDNIQGSPAVANGSVFIANLGGKVVSLDEEHGTLNWSKMLTGFVVGNCTVAHGRVYVGLAGSLQGTMYALNEHTGSIEWSFATGDVIYSTPAVSDGRVFFGSQDKNLYSLDEGSGTLLWSYTASHPISYSAPLVHGGRVYIGSADQTFYAVNEYTGELAWSYYAVGGVVETSPSYHNGSIFFGARGSNSVYSLSEADGALNWSYRAGDDVSSSPTIANGNVFFGCTDGKLYVLDEGTGSFKWSYGTGWEIYSTPTVYQNRLFFGSWNTKLYCFENDVSPESPANTMQYRYDGVAAIPTGEWTNKGKVIFKMTMDDLNDFDTLYPEIELRPTSEAFIGVPTSTGEGVLRSGEAVTGITTVDGIASGLYHWRARVRDTGGWGSGWMAFGGNSETQPDFKMDAIVPAITVTNPVANCIVMAGATTEVSWIVTEEGGSGLVTNPITLYYSTNNGGAWELIASNEANDGSYIWTAPWVSSANFRISVEAEDNAGNVGMGVSGKFSVLRPGWISGTVTLSGEADNSGTLVEAFDSGEVWGSAETASDGSYLIQVLEGTYSVEATKPGFEIKDYPSAVTVPPVSTVEGVDLVLPGAWPMFKQDRWHTGDSPDKVMNTPLAMRWSYTTGDLVYSNPIEVNGKVFVGSYDCNVYALNARTGAFIWSYPTGGGPAVHVIDGATSVANGMVFIGNEAGKFYALDEDTGQLKWEKDVGGYILGSSTVAHNRVYVPGGHSIFALDQYTGSIKWSYRTDDSVYSTPAVIDGMLFFGGWDSNVYALDEASGSLIWSYNVGALGTITYSSPAVHDGRVFIGSENNNLYCLDEFTGGFIWSYHTMGVIQSSPSINAGKVFMGSQAGMYAVDEVSGSLDWSYDTTSFIDGAPTISNGNIFFGTGNGKMIALDEDTGSFKWSYAANGAIWSEPTTYGNKLYFSSFDHNVYCFENNVSPEAPSLLRQFQQDNLTEIPTGDWTNNAAFFRMQMSDPNDFDTLYPEVEIIPTSTSFTKSPNASGGGVVYEASPVEGTAEVIGLVNMQGYHWQARVRDFAGFTSPWVSFGGNLESDADLIADTITPETPAPFNATALPAASPEYVSLVWGVVTDESPGSGLAGYNMYRSSSHGSGYAKMNSAFLTSTSTNDMSAAFGNNYYYVVTARDNAGNESQYSTESSPPNLVVTKTMTIEAPKLGGYSGGPTDAVPGSTITYTMIYVNNGFAPGSSIVVVDKIPPHTEYKLESATGEGITSVLFSNNYGGTYSYVPSGTLVDGNVTNIKWNLANIAIGASAEASFKVVIQ